MLEKMNCARLQTIISKIKSNMHRPMSSFDQLLPEGPLGDDSDQKIRRG